VQSSVAAPLWMKLLPLIIVVAILAFRFLRPQRISVTRMFVQPLILCFVAGYVIYISATYMAARPLEIGVAVVVGAILGVPFGILRGMHTDVRPTERPGVMYLGSSWATIAVFAVAFGLRFAIRSFLPQTGALSGTVGDGLLGFAIAFIVASYVVIYRKYRAEVEGRLASPPAPPV
jgi:hypothetical protein